MSFIIPSSIPSSVHTMKTIGLNLKIVAHCDLKDSQMKWWNGLKTWVSKLSLFTQRLHSSFVRSLSSFIFEHLDFLGFRFGKYLRKNLSFSNPEKVHTMKIPEFILEIFISQEFSPPCGCAFSHLYLAFFLVNTLFCSKIR